jgi:hypothetical protein
MYIKIIDPINVILCEATKYNEVVDNALVAVYRAFMKIDALRCLWFLVCLLNQFNNQFNNNFHSDIMRDVIS